MNKKLIFLCVTILSIFTVSCREVTDDPIDPIVFNPTPAPVEMIMAGAAPVLEVIVLGNATVGEEWFLDQGCNACHSTGSDEIVGPGQAGVYERAVTRPGYSSADEYIEASIKYPAEYIVDGYSNLMPDSWEEAEKQEIADVIAYLKTLK